MARFEWKADLATGDEVVDSQHRQLIEFANRFLEAAQHGREKAILQNSFEMLERYTHEHFRDEERLFRKIGSRRLDDQRTQHAQMRNELKAIRSLWMSNFGFVNEVPRALEAWLETRLLPHFFEHDRRAFEDRRASPPPRK
ncbi:MAG: hemerythrin domain-containing protein [Rhodospirillales bacterium]|nr:hemerythrin domain-containing protein [Rhodospirillales bacterium]